MRQRVKPEAAEFLAGYRAFSKLYPKDGLVATFSFHDPEEGWGEPKRSSERVGRVQMFRELVDYAGLEAVAACTKFEQVVGLAYEMYEEGEAHLIALETQKEADDRRADEERKRLEKAARELAERHNVAVGSMDFIRACEDELARFSNYREGMREDGLCMGYGVTADQWYEEFNSSVGDSSAVYDILDWLERECPLLMAKYREEQMRGEETA
jgi:hypothetical protein